MTALIASAAVTVAAPWETFSDHRWLWVRFTAAFERLTEISKTSYTPCPRAKTSHPPKSTVSILDLKRSSRKRARPGWTNGSAILEPTNELMPLPPVLPCAGHGSMQTGSTSRSRIYTKPISCC